MSKRVWSSRSVAASLAAPLVLAVLAGCSSSSNSGSPSGPAGTGSPSAGSVDASLRALLPAAILSSGTIRFGTTATNPPQSLLGANSTTITGVIPNLMTAVGRTLGLKVDFIKIPFTGLVPGLQADKYDAIGGIVYDTAAREGTLNIVDYQKGTTSILVTSSITSEYGSCGKTFATSSGGTGQEQLEVLSAACKARGLQPIKTLLFTEGSLSQTEALLSGRVVGTIGTADALTYLADHDLAGKGFHTLPITQIPPTILGVGVLKSNTGLANAIVGALKVLSGNGQYAQILAEWKSPAGALTVGQFGVNGASKISASS